MFGCAVLIRWAVFVYKITAWEFMQVVFRKLFTRHFCLCEGLGEITHLLLKLRVRELRICNLRSQIHDKHLQVFLAISLRRLEKSLNGPGRLENASDGSGNRGKRFSALLDDIDFNIHDLSLLSEAALADNTKLWLEAIRARWGKDG